MEISNKLYNVAKRHATALTDEFSTLIRAVGEAKSKAEEDALIQRMISISKQQIKDGVRSKGDNAKSLKDLLVYLIYINMLGHETSWAAATIIQLCSHKSLAVKKAAYLATSLLIPPTSELNIMVTATIQADLKSDNFLVVATALSAIAHSATSELVSVFLPQVLQLLRHDRDHVKKKALLALHRLIQVDQSVASDAERPLVEKLGYKEPSVMVAALPSLHELIRVDPAPYRNLVHYFTNILKQAAEGKLGKSWDYHRAPAPFVQIELLRLLALLGKDDEQTTKHMEAVILEVWRKADTLPSTASNALLYECMQTATSVYPTDALLSAAMNSVGKFIAGKENNLKYAGINILSRLVGGDAGRVEQYQLAIVECLRSPDITLKRKTLDLLFKMANPGNVSVVAEEVLSYLKEASDDVAARRAAAHQLVLVAERDAPNSEWLADVLTQLLELETGDKVVPAEASEGLVKLLVHGRDGEEDVHGLRKSVADRYLSLLERPKLPSSILKIACYIAGEYGLLLDRNYDSVVESVAVVLETQATDDAVASAVAVALGKLAIRSGKGLNSDAMNVLDSLTQSQSVEVQQTAAEIQGLLAASPTTQQTALVAATPRNTNGNAIVDIDLAFLDGYIHQAEAAGAAPYLLLEDRVAMGVVRQPASMLLYSTTLASATPGGGANGGNSGIKYQAYETAQAPAAGSTIGMGGEGNVTSSAATAQGQGGLSDLWDLGYLNMTKDTKSSNTTLPSPAAAAPSSSATEGLRIGANKARKWGPQAVAPTPSVTAAAPPPSPSPSSVSRSPNPRQQPTNATPSASPMDPAQQRLAASLFGSGGGLGGRASSSRAPIPKTGTAHQQAPQMDLLGDLIGGTHDSFAPVQEQQSGSTTTADLFSLDVPTPASNNGNPMPQMSGFDLLGDTSSSLPNAASPARSNSVYRPMSGGGNVQNKGPQDPFANLLG